MQIQRERVRHIQKCFTSSRFQVTFKLMRICVGSINELEEQTKMPIVTVLERYFLSVTIFIHKLMKFMVERRFD